MRYVLVHGWIDRTAKSARTACGEEMSSAEEDVTLCLF